MVFCLSVEKKEKKMDYGQATIDGCLHHLHELSRNVSFGSGLWGVERWNFADRALRVVSILVWWTAAHVDHVRMGDYYLIMSVISFVAFQ
jgi:hypothetical protein